MHCDNLLWGCCHDTSKEASSPVCLPFVDGKDVRLENSQRGEMCSHFTPPRPVDFPWKKLAPVDRRPCEWTGGPSPNSFLPETGCDGMAEWFLDTTCDCGAEKIVLFYCDNHRKIFDGA